jgi:hypothetical protein
MTISTQETTFGEDEDEEHLSIVWGILRVPIACTKCGTLTRTPSYWSGDEPSPAICNGCFRKSMGYV